MPWLLLSSLLAAEPTGSVCLLRATWEVPKGALASEASTPPAVKKFSARIDDGEDLDLSAGPGRVDGLALEGKHRMRIFADGKPRETFFFTFKGRGPRLTLRYRGFYDSWSLETARRECPE
jgi:hypothetical protein